MLGKGNPREKCRKPIVLDQSPIGSEDGIGHQHMRNSGQGSLARELHCRLKEEVGKKNER